MNRPQREDHISVQEFMIALRTHNEWVESLNEEAFNQYMNDVILGIKL